MIDIVILDHEREVVTIVKADPKVIEKDFGNDIERYIEEFPERQMRRNQEAGMRFDDFWMFDGKYPKGWYERITV